MTLKDSFNSGYEFSAQSGGNTLRAYSDGIWYRYDFAQRLLVVAGGQSIVVTPFSQIDRETLIEMRDKLVELKGNPPELPAEQSSAPAAPRRLNP